MKFGQIQGKKDNRPRITAVGDYRVRVTQFSIFETRDGDPDYPAALMRLEVDEVLSGGERVKKGAGHDLFIWPKREVNRKYTTDTAANREVAYQMSMFKIADAVLCALGEKLEPTGFDGEGDAAAFEKLLPTLASSDRDVVKQTPIVGRTFLLRLSPKRNSPNLREDFEVDEDQEAIDWRNLKTEKKAPPPVGKKKGPQLPEGWEVHPEDADYAYNPETEEVKEIAELLA